MSKLAEDDQDVSRTSSVNMRLVGDSPAMMLVKEFVNRVATMKDTVLITGQQGVGKELCARCIHDLSSHRKKTFKTLSCNAIPGAWRQLKLFGGSTRLDQGSNVGTLYLREVAELPLELQRGLANFLTLLQSHPERATELPRVIAGSSRSLEKAVSQRRMLRELYTVLAVFQVEMPPLSKRGSDIEQLAQLFLSQLTGPRRVSRNLSSKALLAMGHYHWPGNVRELLNRVRRAVVLSDNRQITPKDLGLDLDKHPQMRSTLDEARATAEKDAIRAQLIRANHNVSEAARRLGVSRVTLYRLIRKYELVGDTRFA